MSEPQSPIPVDSEVAFEAPPVAESSIVRISARTAIILLLFTVVFTALMAATYFATKPAIDASARAEKMKLIDEILPKAYYDNDLLADDVALPPVTALGLTDDSNLYRARRNGQPVALVFEAAAPDGYSGRIGLLLAVDAAGKLIAMRVTGHRETPGLGDYIDPKKDKNKASPWIAQFSGRALDQIGPEQWRVRKDGGVFDAHTGATISARAVTNASGKALAWVAGQRDKLFGLPTDGKWEN